MPVEHTVQSAAPGHGKGGREGSVESIRVRGARVHNLKNIDVEIHHGEFTVVTGVSGSGKSSLAFDTLYAEGQRRYVESLSAYARQFLERMEKPDADEITGIAPAVAIRQKNSTRNPRSTVGTATEIYDYLRLLFARIGKTYCGQCGAEVKKDSVDEVADRLIALSRQSGQPDGLRAYILFPMSPDSPAAGINTRAAAAPAPSAAKPRSSRQPRETAKAAAKQDNMEQLRTRLFELRKLGFNRLYQNGGIFEFSTPESLLEIDFSKPVEVLADRLVLSADSRQRLIDSIEICYREGGEAVVEIPDLSGGTEDSAAAPGAPLRLTFNERFECKTCRIAYEVPEPRLFSFNSPYGACPRCQGFGNTIDFDPQLVIPDVTKTLDQGAVEPWTKPRYRHFYNEFKKIAETQSVRTNVPFLQLTPEEKEFVWEGSTQRGRGARRGWGVKAFFDYLERKKYKLHVRVFLSRYRGYALCPDCKGGRLRAEAYQVKVAGRDLRSVCQMSIEQARQFFDGVQLSTEQQAIAEKILQEVQQRLRFLENVGLEYLTLDRLASTLSGGEAQRIQLAASLGSRLVGALYVLDEPSIGLHSRDTDRLIRILKELRDQGNTVLVVEHDPAMMEAADWVLDMGPGAGENGGKLQFAGTYSELVSRNSTLTGCYLNGNLRISLPAFRRPMGAKQLKVYGAFAHNLKNIDVEVPLGMMVAVTGVSGSGKSTLIHDVIFKALSGPHPGASGNNLPEFPPSAVSGKAVGDDGELETLEQTRSLGCRKIEGMQHVRNVVLVDQSPIGRTPRSNPVTYIKAYDGIRALFASMPDARKRGYTPGHFSFNVAGGRCEACQGDGTVTVEMQFLADVELVCEECRGARFKSGVLEIRYRGKNIHEVLQLTVKEALAFFAGHHQIVQRLRVLDEVGLGYLRLGQSATTLSGGEAQRVKLAAHLALKESPATLFIFDEPTTGLHFDDISKLLSAFRKLIDNNGSVLIIEHNLDVIKTADWVIDLGPEGGERGGELVCSGTPETIAQCERSYTGQYLRPVLEKHREWGEELPPEVAGETPEESPEEPFALREGVKARRVSSSKRKPRVRRT